MQLPATPSGAAFNLDGAATDAAGNLFVLGSDGSSPTQSWVAVAQISTNDASNIIPWTQLRTQTGATPTLAERGDIFFDATGQSYIMTATATPSYYKLDLNPDSSFGEVTSPSQAISGLGSVIPRGVSVDPATGVVYLGGTQTFMLNLATGVATADDITTTYSVVDQGNCSAPVPDLPAVQVSFEPTGATAAFRTTTLTIEFSNTNLAPIWLNQTFKNVLPSNMWVTSTSAIASEGCGSIAGNTVTTSVRSTSITFAQGSQIPVGGCTISVVVTATRTGAFINAIAAGTLTTTVGTNTAAASAAYLVSTRDFTVSIAQRAGSSDSFSSEATSIPAGGTVQYQVTITNSGSSQSSGTVTFTDTLPSLVTPVLSIVIGTATDSGNCSAASAVVSGRTRVTGTYARVNPGASCFITITARGSATLAASTAVSNTVTIAGTTRFPDPGTANNSATVTTVINPAAHLAIFKTNSTSTVPAGASVTYTITVVNSGPAAAPNALVRDPAVAGLSCSTVDCTSAVGGAACPTGAQQSIANLQGNGIPIPTFPGAVSNGASTNTGSTVTLVIGCTVTATGG